jgi:cellulose synthase/poly-beta-1,6-N-acetylglucosamine synthase-like glycosyltransferase
MTSKRQPVEPMEVECSVVIATRGRPQRLAACLESLAAQDYPPERFEVIVIDGGVRAGNPMPLPAVRPTP